MKRKDPDLSENDIKHTENKKDMQMINNRKLGVYTNR